MVMKLVTAVVLLLVLLYPPLCVTETAGNRLKLKIAALNPDIFGQKKFSNTLVTNSLSKIVRHYDVILLEEIRDSSETLIHKFLEIVNTDVSHQQQSTTSESAYALAVSERLGRTSNKEQYAFFYRTDKLKVLSTHQYDDSAKDEFEREPFSILVHVIEQDANIPDFFLMGIRTKPSATIEEINALTKAYDQAVSFFGTDNGIILGDLSADCSYLSRSNYEKLDLVTDTRFTWLIDDDIDTTTGSSKCAYDRIVVAGNISYHVVEGSANAFHFDQEYGMSAEEAAAVSNHYPVEVTLDLEGPTHFPEPEIVFDFPLTDSNTLKIAAFNIQVFGGSKHDKDEVVSVLMKIVRQYDITLIQEIRDSSEIRIFEFLKKINSKSNNLFSLKVSERLGRTTSKEQYGYMYRNDKVEVLETDQYSDIEDKFEREPYSVLVRVIHPDLNIPDFFLVGAHIKPSDAVAELNAMDDVYDTLTNKFGTLNGILLGDFNADCSYVSKTKYLNLDLVKDKRFTWLVDSDVDTTVSLSDCAYDRILVAGDLINYVVNKTASVFRFDEEYGLTAEESKRVSDHYPVEITLHSGIVDQHDEF